MTLGGRPVRRAAGLRVQRASTFFALEMSRVNGIHSRIRDWKIRSMLENPGLDSVSVEKHLKRKRRSAGDA